jgi:uncharacterized protein (DUF924 family)
MYQDVLNFWFQEIGEAGWWRGDARLDRQITQRFAELHARATRCELYAWRTLPHGRLAEIIVLDQFSRNMFRDSARAFAYDSLALALAQEAIAAHVDEALNPVERSFLYVPFMHSESPAIHQIAVGLFHANGIEVNFDFELKHKEIIDRFGRYPHRNSALGRASTPGELEFLKQPGSRF